MLPVSGGMWSCVLYLGGCGQVQGQVLAGKSRVRGMSWCVEFAVLPAKKLTQANPLGSGSTP